MKTLKKFSLGKKKVSIQLSNIYFQNQNIFIFGHPLNIDTKKISEKYLMKNLKKFLGYFFIIIKKKRSLILITDVTANKRVYFSFNKGILYIFDKINRKDLKKNQFNKSVFNFFITKNYTPGNITFFNNIKKFQPCSIYEFFEGKLHSKIYFENIKNTPSDSTLIKKIDLYLNRVIKKLNGKKIILLFSGGRDSTLLLQYLQNNNADFIPVYLKTDPKSHETEKNFYLAKNICKHYNVELKVINVKINSIDKIISFIKKNLIFDYHLSILFYLGFKKIKKKYGKSSIVLTGQSLDSIVSFGPSQKTIGNFLARLMNHYPFSLVSLFSKFLLSIKFKKNFKLGKNDYEFYKNFYYNYYYYPVFFDQKIDKVFFEKLFHDMKNIKETISKLMYLKIHGFLQGSDNMVIINSANNFQINKVFMPFSSYYFIYNICRYYNFKKDVFFPKYIVNKLLNTYDFKNEKVNPKFKLSAMNTKTKKTIVSNILNNYDT